VLPGAYGNTLAYADFARLLGPDQPVHVLQPVGFEGYGKPLERIESIAEHCIKEIRRLQPTGPYRLAGFCIGGIVAFEMAQQLIAAGEEPPLLALIDTWHPASIPKIRGAPAALRPLIFLFQGLGRHLRALLTLPPSRAVRHLRENSAIVKQMILRKDVYRGDRYKRYRDVVMEANYRAGSRYVPNRYPGRILLLIAENHKVQNDLDTRLVWRELAGKGSLVVRIPARESWELLKKPYVQALAESLTASLRDNLSAPDPTRIHKLVS
jgi:thioesterase domain-containing protein